jgi:hypothetical protein
MAAHYIGEPPARLGLVLGFGGFREPQMAQATLRTAEVCAVPPRRTRVHPVCRARRPAGGGAAVGAPRRRRPHAAARRSARLTVTRFSCAEKVGLTPLFAALTFRHQEPAPLVHARTPAHGQAEMPLSPAAPRSSRVNGLGSPSDSPSWKASRISSWPRSSGRSSPAGSGWLPRAARRWSQCLPWRARLLTQRVPGFVRTR